MYFNAEVTTEGTILSGVGVSGTNKAASTLDHSFSFPNHGNNGARGEIVDESSKEGLVLQVRVVLGSEVLGGLHDLDSNEFVSLSLEAECQLIKA